MTLFAIESTAKVASAAICTEDRVIARTSLHTGLTHSETLMPICTDLLKRTGITPDGVDGFAISVGPGSFTGLRIGIATVKGLAYATDKPCYPVSTLEALARNLIGMQGLACAVMDARRDQVYYGLFRLSSDSVTRLRPDCAISLTELFEELREQDEPVWLCGDGADLVFHRLPADLTTVHLAPFALRMQSAVGVASAAFASGKAVSAKELTPVYLRLSQAERERAERIKKEEEAE